jgi:hypothetical protein
MNCPKCGKPLNPEAHQELVFNGQTWCCQCHSYDWELIRLRQADDIRVWGQRLCAAFGEDPVPIEIYPAMLTRQGRKIQVAEVHHRLRLIDLYTPGLTLVTLCHELAHVFTAEDHTTYWAQTFAQLVAWVKGQLPPLKKPFSSLE